MKLEATKQVVTVPRMVQVYSDRWDGPRPGTVVKGFGSWVANINVNSDGTTDRDFLAAIRASPSGNTVPMLTVHDYPDGATSEDLANAVPTRGQEWRLTPEFTAKVLAVWPPRV
ncbi:MAG: hypothetical protein ACKVZJ_09580 [Phycisphaerales bacterium]